MSDSIAHNNTKIHSNSVITTKKTGLSFKITGHRTKFKSQYVGYNRER